MSHWSRLATNSEVWLAYCETEAMDLSERSSSKGAFRAVIMISECILASFGAGHRSIELPKPGDISFQTLATANSLRSGEYMQESACEAEVIPVITRLYLALCYS